MGAVRLIEGLYNLNMCGPLRPSLLRYVTLRLRGARARIRLWSEGRGGVFYGKLPFAPMRESFKSFKAERMRVPGVI